MTPLLSLSIDYTAVKFIGETDIFGLKSKAIFFAQGTTRIGLLHGKGQIKAGLSVKTVMLVQ